MPIVQPKIEIKDDYKPHVHCCTENKQNQTLMFQNFLWVQM